MPQIIQIPKPCHEDWNRMTPNEQGRHCAQCAKTVVDFTGWQPAEIIFYLKMNAGACGRFRNDQLDVALPSPEDFVQEIVRMPFSFIKRIAAIFLFVFGLMAGISCHQPQVKYGQREPTLLGDTVVTAKQLPPTTAGTVSSQPDTPMLLGEPAIVDPQITAGAPDMINVPDSISPDKTRHK